MKLTTYLNFGGNCLEAFRFYEQHLGAKILFSMTFNQMPEPKQVPEGWGDATLHASLSLAGSIVQGSDVPPGRFQPMRSAYLALALDSSEEVERAYHLLSEGGEIFMPMQETFFAFRFGMLRDRFGVSWMLLHERPQG